MTYKEHEQVTLTTAIRSDEGLELRPRDVATIIHIHPEEQAFVVEFMSLDGETVAIATVLPSQARPVTSADLTYARILERAV